jgi:hypothetical protein
LFYLVEGLEPHQQIAILFLAALLLILISGRNALCVTPTWPAQRRVPP